MIGNSSTLLDGSDVGDNCVVCAGSLIGSGARIPDRSFVSGNPAKVLREISETQLESITRGTSTYMKLAKEYKAEGL